MIVNRKALLPELQWIDRFIQSKSTIPILQDALFSADGKHLTLTATDLENGAITGVEGQGRQKWVVAAPAKKLIRYLQKVDEDEVVLGKSENHWLVVTHGPHCTRIAGMSGESFPELPKFPEPVATLGRLPLAVQRTAFAISSEETRFTLNGALLEIDEAGARMIATDGHRLALAPLQAKCDGKVRALITKFALLEAARLEGDCVFAMDEAHVFFSWGQRKILSRKLTGNFPDYHRVLPEEFDNHAYLPVKATQKMLDRVSEFADERSHATVWSIADGKLTVSASSVETGASKGTVPIRIGDGGAPIELGLNAEYILDVLARTDNQNMALCWMSQELDDNGNPKPDRRGVLLMSDDGWQVITMQMRL